MPHRTVTGLAALVAALTIAGSWALHRHFSRPDPFDHASLPIPVRQSVSSDLQGINQHGLPASFSAATRGRIAVCAYLWTGCPDGCANVFGTMRQMRDFFSDHPDLQFVSVAVLPEIDPPVQLAQFAYASGLSPSDPWLFLSGFPQTSAWDFMHHQLGLSLTIAPAPNPGDPPCCRRCDHDLRIVLLDRQQRVRGHYEVNAAIPEKREFFRAKLFGDTARLLAGPD